MQSARAEPPDDQSIVAEGIATDDEKRALVLELGCRMGPDYLFPGHSPFEDLWRWRTDIRSI